MLQQPLFLPLCLSDLPSGLPPPSVDPSAALSLALLWLFASSITRQRGKREREREAASYTKAAPLPPPFFPSLLPSMLSVGRSVGLLFLCSKQPFTSGAALQGARGPRLGDWAGEGVLAMASPEQPCPRMQPCLALSPSPSPVGRVCSTRDIGKENGRGNGMAAAAALKVIKGGRWRLQAKAGYLTHLPHPYQSQQPSPPSLSLLSEL